MKRIFVIYTIIGLILTPFIYSNNAEEYKPGSSAYRIGRSLGNALYWPSYLFYIEPVVDGKSVDSFQTSIIFMLKWRANKLHTMAANNVDGAMVATAIGDCLVTEGLSDQDMLSLGNNLLSGTLGNAKIEKMRANVVKNMDGYHFANIIAAGAKCQANNMLLVKTKAAPVK